MALALARVWRHVAKGMLIVEVAFRGMGASFANLLWSLAGMRLYDDREVAPASADVGVIAIDVRIVRQADLDQRIARLANVT